MKDQKFLDKIRSVYSNFQKFAYKCRRAYMEMLTL